MTVPVPCSTTPVLPGTRLPAAQGLYDPTDEHDACGVGFVVDRMGRRSHEMVRHGLTVLENLDHRGATGAEENVGDGAGILIQVPDRFLREVCGFTLPEAGTYATGIAFLPRLSSDADAACAHFGRIADEEGMRVVGWRDVPVDDSALGSMAIEVEPTFRQVVLAAADDRAPLTDLDLERAAFVVRKRVEHEVRAADGTGVYFPSVRAHARLQGDADDPAARDVLPRPLRRTRRERHGARPLPLLHQHVPVVAARPSLPAHRPQR